MMVFVSQRSPGSYSRGGLIRAARRVPDDRRRRLPALRRDPLHHRRTRGSSVRPRTRSCAARRRGPAIRAARAGTPGCRLAEGRVADGEGLVQQHGPGHERREQVRKQRAMKIVRDDDRRSARRSGPWPARGPPGEGRRAMRRQVRIEAGSRSTATTAQPRSAKRRVCARRRTRDRARGRPGPREARTAGSTPTAALRRAAASTGRPGQPRAQPHGLAHVAHRLAAPGRAPSRSRRR